MKTPRAVILVRVSSRRQETERQKSELTAAAQQKGWQVTHVIEEVVTGKADENNRPGLKEVMALVEAGKVDKVMVHEVSRLSRRPAVLHKVLEQLDQAGVSLFWQSQSIETLLPNGKRNPAAAIMLALMGELARAEVELLSERIKSGLAEARRQGKRLGRPEGKASTADFLEAHKASLPLIRSHPNLSIRNLAKLAGKSPGTIVRIRMALAGVT